MPGCARFPSYDSKSTPCSPRGQGTFMPRRACRRQDSPQTQPPTADPWHFPSRQGCRNTRRHLACFQSRKTLQALGPRSGTGQGAGAGGAGWGRGTPWLLSLLPSGTETLCWSRSPSPHFISGCTVFLGKCQPPFRGKTKSDRGFRHRQGNLGFGWLVGREGRSEKGCFRSYFSSR